MKLAWSFLGATAVAALGASLVACNGVLGINSAALEPDAGAGEASTALSCDTYCATITQNCTGADQEYLTQDVCNSMCPAFEVNGTVADTADDTLGCRMFFAQQAAQTPDTSCRFAGPLGGGHCGNAPCQDFCSLDVNYCKGDKPVTYEGGVPDCLSACQGFPYLTADAGDTTLESTNTLNCRLWHLETAYGSDQAGQFHCPHTAQMSTTCQ